MSNSHQDPRLDRDPASKPLPVTIEGRYAGFAIPEGASFRFVATHPDFSLLDGSSFFRVTDLRAAAHRLFEAAQSVPPADGWSVHRQRSALI
jgi:hypothetical protein